MTIAPSMPGTSFSGCDINGVTVAPWAAARAAAARQIPVRAQIVFMHSSSSLSHHASSRPGRPRADRSGSRAVGSRPRGGIARSREELRTVGGMPEASAVRPNDLELAHGLPWSGWRPMTTERTFTESAVPLVRPRLGVRPTALSDHWAMTKPDVNLLIAITTATAFCLAARAGGAPFPWVRLLHTLAGTMLVASGAAVLNQWMERHFDALMRRTARRPVAAGRIQPGRALALGTLASLAGLAYLAGAVGWLPSLLALATLLAYLFLYTPAKRRTPLCTLIGAIPGAIPPLIGWAAARGRLDAGAWLLYAIVFLWQFPHFMAIAWMYRDDYDRAGYLVLPRGVAQSRLVA